MRFFIVLSLFSFDLYAQSEIHQKTIDAFVKTETAKNIENKINQKLNKIPKKDITLKTLAIGQVLANKRFDLEIDSNSNVNLDYKKEQIIYNYNINF